jgi:hypothetical protein
MLKYKNRDIIVQFIAETFEFVECHDLMLCYIDTQK